MDREFKSHPSYGKIVLTKPSCGGPGGGQPLFGSKVKHPSFISMEIEEAKITEDGFSEFIYGGDTLIKVYLSEAQWAHMLSSFGDGSGTPCTIARVKGEGYRESPPEAVPVLDLAKETATKTKNDLVTRLRNLEADVKKVSDGTGPVKKSDLKRLALDFNILASWLDSNFDYLENQVTERMEKEVAKAHLEIEALINNAVTRLGERALAAGAQIDLSKLNGGSE